MTVCILCSIKSGNHVFDVAVPLYQILADFKIFRAAIAGGKYPKHRHNHEFSLRGCSNFLPKILMTFFSHHHPLTRVRVSLSTAALPLNSQIQPNMLDKNIFVVLGVHLHPFHLPWLRYNIQNK